MEDDYWEEIWRCRKHPSPPRSGVCPACLRDRLLLICADCANKRPCACSASTSSSSFDDYVGGDSAATADGVGAVGRVANLIESEPAFRRSRSVTFQFLMPRLEAAAPRPKGRLAIWPFYRAAAPGEVEVKLSKSRSVGVSYPDRRCGGGGEVRGKGWKWHFPSPMKVFRQRKAANVVRVRSPLCRG